MHNLTEKGDGIFIDPRRMQNIYLVLATVLFFRMECYVVLFLALVHIVYMCLTHMLWTMAKSIDL